MPITNCVPSSRVMSSLFNICCDFFFFFIPYYLSLSSCFGKYYNKITSLKGWALHRHKHFRSGHLICYNGSKSGDKYQNRANMLHIFQIFSMSYFLRIRDFLSRIDVWCFCMEQPFFFSFSCLLNLCSKQNYP